MGVSRTFIHEVDFYSDDRAFLQRLSHKLAADLRAGRGVILVTTERHRAALTRDFQSLGLDIETARNIGRYVCLDAGETLREMAGDAGIVADRFKRAVGGLIDEVSHRSPDLP